MAATNHTENFNLPQYIGTDKPTYLGDWNSTMGTIDSQMKTNADNASGALSTAQTAQTNANTALSTAQGADTKADTAITNASTAQSTADNATNVATSALSTANTANSKSDTNTNSISALDTKVGDLSDLDTIDKTSVVNAINEVVESDFIYSTTEIKTDAKWINNKPIYRKVLNIGARSFAQGNNNIIHDISNIDKVVNVEFELCMNNSWYHTWDNILNVIIRSNEFNIYANAPFTADDCYVLIEYTKTTD